MRKTNQWLPGMGEGGTTKGHQETFGSDGYVHYLDASDGFMGVDTCQNLSNCTL